MKKQYLIVIIFCFISLSIFSQGSFFKHSNTLYSSAIYFAKEINGNYYLAGGRVDSNNAPNGLFLIKIDAYGNISKTYNYFNNNRSQNIAHIITPNDSTIRLFIGDYGYSTTNILIQDLNFNLSVENEIRYRFPDSSGITLYDLTEDNDGNIVITGLYKTHPLYNSPEFYEGFLLKLSANLDSLAYYEKHWAIFNNIEFNPYTNLYYTSGSSYNLRIFNKALDSMRTIRVDTFIPVFYSHLFIDTNKISIIGYTYDSFKNEHRPILIKNIDTLGNEYNRIVIDAPDTVSAPGFGTMISKCSDSTSLYFSWKKNVEPSNCNNGEPRYIGIAKMDYNLNPIWIKYFGNDTVSYEPIHQTATSDGGVLVVGYYQHCEIMDFTAHYFVLKVDANGNCTFMKDLPLMNKQFKVYPNPATNYINLSLEKPATKIKQIIIYDINSKEVKNINNPLNNKLNIKNLNSGSYFVKAIDSEGNVFSAKFIKK